MLVGRQTPSIRPLREPSVWTWLAACAAAVAGGVVLLVAQRALRAPELAILAGGFRQLRLGGIV
jgi:hypothetical protein